jgi:hypothetical protein
VHAWCGLGFAPRLCERVLAGRMCARTSLRRSGVSQKFPTQMSTLSSLEARVSRKQGVIRKMIAHLVRGRMHALTVFHARNA